MEQPIIVGAAVLLAFLIASSIIWFIGHKKASTLNGEITALAEEIIRLKEALTRSEENASKVPGLTEEISRYSAKEENLREEITKLTNSLMAEVQKSASIQEISSKLARNEVVLEGLENASSKDKETISQLSKQITEKELITAENNAILKRLKEVFAKA